MNDIKKIEQESAKIEDLQENYLPSVARLRDQIEDLEDQRSKALIKVALGESRNGTVDKITQQIAATKQELADKEKLAEGLVARKEDLRIQEQAIKLGLMQAEFKILAPEVEKLADQYLKQREALRKTVEEYNEKHSRASNLRSSIQTFRNALGVGQQDVGDLPGVRNVNFNTKEHGISIEQLQGKRPW